MTMLQSHTNTTCRAAASLNKSFNRSGGWTRNLRLKVAGRRPVSLGVIRQDNSGWLMIGCAAMIGIVAFVIGLIAAVIANDPTFPHPLIVGAMTGGMTFVAALILVARDRGRHTSTIRNVRQVLLARQDINDGDYLAHFPDANSTLVAQTRQAVSDFFDVPVQKIHPTDSLRDDLQFDIDTDARSITLRNYKLAGGAQLFVLLYHVVVLSYEHGLWKLILPRFRYDGRWYHRFVQRDGDGAIIYDRRGRTEIEQTFSTITLSSTNVGFTTDESPYTTWRSTSVDLTHGKSLIITYQATRVEGAGTDGADDAKRRQSIAAGVSPWKSDILPYEAPKGRHKWFRQIVSPLRDFY